MSVPFPGKKLHLSPYGLFGFDHVSTAGVRGKLIDPRELGERNDQNGERDRDREREDPEKQRDRDRDRQGDTARKRDRDERQRH